MPKATHPQRTKQLLRAFSQHWYLLVELRKQRKALTCQHIPNEGPNLDLDVGLSSSSGSEADSDEDFGVLSSLSSDSLGSGSWWSASDMSDTESDEEELRPIINDTFIPAACRYHGLSDNADVGWEGDDESDGPGAGDSYWTIRSFVVNELNNMHAHRYELPRHRLPRGPPYLPHVLKVLKDQRPDHFRQALRVSPSTFDAIVERISNDLVFSNQSNQAQIPVKEQLGITLYRFGHNGNAASLQSVADWAGVGKGTVTLATRRVMTAILRPEFMHEAVRMPNNEEKEAAKEWVAAHSCDAWRNGWCMVDGTLIPLYARPYWYGSSYFDWKSNYSMNVSVSTLRCVRGMIDIPHRSCHSQTSALLTSVMATPEVPMTQQPGVRRGWRKSTVTCWRTGSGFGPTQHIQYVFSH